MAFKKITIDRPCSQDWDQMTPQNGGRHCASCQHVVTDFSAYTEQELVKAMESGDHHCGRFDVEQLERMYYVAEATKERKRYWSAIAAAIVGGFLQLTTSYAQTDQQPSGLKKVERYRLHAKTDEVKTDSVKEETSTIKEIRIRVFSKKNQRGVSGVSIRIDELGIKGTSDAQGWLVVKIDTKDLDTKQTLHILTDSYRYTDKTATLTLATLLKKEKYIYLKEEPWRGKIMGAYAYF